MKIKTIAILLVLLVLSVGQSFAITISVTPADENYKELSDQLTLDMCSSIYDCFHQQVGANIIPVTGDITTLYNSVRAKNAGLTQSTYDYTNLHATDVNSATEAGHALRSGWAVWSDSANSINPSAEVYTATTITTADVQNAEVTPKAPYVDYAYSANYADIVYKTRIVQELRRYSIFRYSAKNVSLAHYTNQTDLLKTPPLVKTSKDANLIQIHDNSTSY